MHLLSRHNSHCCSGVFCQTDVKDELILQLDLLDFEQILLDCRSFSLFCLSHVTVTDRLETLNKNFLFEYPEIINQTYTGCI